MVKSLTTMEEYMYCLTECGAFTAKEIQTFVTTFMLSPNMSCLRLLMYDVPVTRYGLTLEQIAKLKSFMNERNIFLSAACNVCRTSALLKMLTSSNKCILKLVNLEELARVMVGNHIGRRELRKLLNDEEKLKQYLTI